MVFLLLVIWPASNDARLLLQHAGHRRFAAHVLTMDSALQKAGIFLKRQVADEAGLALQRAQNARRRARRVTL